VKRSDCAARWERACTRVAALAKAGRTWSGSALVHNAREHAGLRARRAMLKKQRRKDVPDVLKDSPEAAAAQPWFKRAMVRASVLVRAAP